MDIQKLRQEFEKLPDIKGILYGSDFSFNESLNQYYHPDHTNHRLNYAFIMGAWMAWKTKAQVPDGFILVPKSEIGHYYYDESEGMYIDEPDHFLTDLDIGEAQEVKCRDYFDLPSKYAAKIWDENNQDVGTWGIFDTEAEANNVAAHCKAMIEAQEQSHENG